MSFTEKLKYIATGKNAEERKLEAEKNAEIRKAAMSAALEERKKQAIKLAETREQVAYQRKIDKIKKPTGFFNTPSEFKTYGDPFGGPRFIRERTITTRKGKKKVIRRTPRYNIRQAIAPSKYNVLGF